MEINWKKNTALFLGGQALSLFGTLVVQYAIFWHITLKSQSGTMMTLFAIAGHLPMFFISPFAGVWADRYNRKYIINIADSVIAFFSLVVAVLLMRGIDNYAILLFCALVRSLGQGAQMPAVGAFIPQIVPEEHLTRINGFQSSIMSFATLASPMTGAALMTVAPLEALFFLDVATAAIGICIVFFFVKVPPRNLVPTRNLVPEGNPRPLPPAQRSADYFHDLREGVRYIGKLGFLLRMILVAAIFQFLFSPVAFLTPLQVTRNFGQDVWRLSAIEIVFSAGMIAGGILIGVWGGFKNRVITLAAACFMCGFLAAVLGVTGNFWIYLGIMALLGVTNPMFNTPAMVIVQTTVDPAYLGRVMSVFTMSSGVMMPLGMVLFGPLADLVSINGILIVTGVLASLLFIPMLASRTLREAGERRELRP